MANGVGRTWSIVCAIAVGMMMAGVTTAPAHDKSIGTELTLDHIDYAEILNLTGHLTSPNEECLPKRTVKLFVIGSAGTPSDTRDDVQTLLDTDRTSLNGAFRLEGEAPEDAIFGVVRVTRKKIGSTGHKHVCQGNKVRFENRQDRTRRPSAPSQPRDRDDRVIG